jgi:hypothetical protein
MKALTLILLSPFFGIATVDAQITMEQLVGLASTDRDVFDERVRSYGFQFKEGREIIGGYTYVYVFPHAADTSSGEIGVQQRVYLGGETTVVFYTSATDLVVEARNYARTAGLEVTDCRYEPETTTDAKYCWRNEEMRLVVDDWRTRPVHGTGRTYAVLVHLFPATAR